MHESLLAPLRDWQPFFQMTGEVAGTLIGLMFVAMSMGARRELAEEDIALASSKIRTFASPTILHLSAVVLAASILCIPVHTVISLCLSLGALGIGGIVYTIITYRFMLMHHRKHPFDKAHWTWHFRLPFFCYGLVLVTAVGLYFSSAMMALLAVAIILFIAIGIRNSWTTTLVLAGYMNR